MKNIFSVLQNSLKFRTVLAFLLASLLGVLFHFMYEWWPNVVTSIFFPVNESIWEHMKIFVSAILVWGLVDKFLLDKFNIYYNNHFFSTVLTSILSIALYLIIYLPL